MPFRAWCARRIALVRFLSHSILFARRTQVPHPAMSPNSVAVITGGASGIGLAAAMRFARFGMKVCIADLGTNRLTEAETKLLSVAPGGASNIMVMAVDVSRIEDVSGLELAVRERFGGTEIGRASCRGRG